MATPLDINRVEIRGGPLVLATAAEVLDLENRLGATFPAGYRQYVTQLGEGVLNDLVRVLPPWRIVSELKEHRGLMAGFWLWDPGKVPFDQEAAMESIQIADTLDGDVIAFHPTWPERIIVLPRHHDRLFDRGPDLLAVIEWVCSGGVLHRHGPKRYFEPLDSRDAASADEVAVDVESAESVARQNASYAPDQPRLERTARDVLLAYFGELRAVEEWAIERSGGHAVFYQDDPPEMGDVDSDELIGRSNEVYRRYCTPALALAKTGGSVPVTSPAPHDASAIRILEEKLGRQGRVTIRTAEDEGDDMVSLREYVLEPLNGQWRIGAERDRGFLDS